MKHIEMVSERHDIRKRATTGAGMKSILRLGAFLAVTGCTVLPGGPPTPSTPATPVFFQPFSAAMDQPALTTIAQAAKLAAEEPDAQITVIGAADPTGSPKANAYLAKTRAQVVADQLSADGVPPARIRTSSAGPVPTPTGATQSGRRVLIEVQ
jgi:outer membrane protein OmpA-like peptidoglycan-associated protein